jgi:hypothetical protein
MRRLVPNFIIDRYKANELRGSFHGAAIFVDLSGFSKMTDALSEHGQHGAEVLADMMSLVFEPLVGAVYAQHGFVIGYAGDAFNAVFLMSMHEHIRTQSQFQTPLWHISHFHQGRHGFWRNKMADI